MFARNISKGFSLPRVSFLNQRALSFSTSRKSPRPPSFQAGELYADTNDELMQAIQESPLALYKQMVNRIETWGSVTPMPEFRPAVK